MVCHTAGSTFANQSDLVLDADVAYEQLVDRDPHNEAARKDGLLLVGKKGLESLFGDWGGTPIDDAVLELERTEEPQEEPKSTQPP